jgi:rfaE bifunctional protein nucleotidyltransferase chain/domain
VNIVLAHGCFDLLHLGHIQHLQEARKLGDRLIVSVTDDKYVSKGIGRPHFNAKQRADALRALACVDEVIINEGADATPIISEIRPNIYVKGIDYKEDVGSDLAREKAAIEAVGGKLVFTDSEKFSSSRLINSERFSPDVVRYLEVAKAAEFKDKILAAFDKADQLKISFVGEVIIDEYRYVQGIGRASKEMMLASVEVGSERFEGGSIAASKHAEWAKAEWMATGENIKKTRYVD